MVIRFSFTKKKLTDIEVPSNSRKYVYDLKVNGLGLTITKTGSKSFFVYRKIHGTPKRITLGKFPDMTIEQARKTAVSLISQIAGGKDPAEEKRGKKAYRITLQEVFDDYLDTHINLKPGTILDYKYAINQTFSDWLNKPLANITEDMVLARHKKRGESSKARANNSMRVLRALFNFAKARYKNNKGRSFVRDNPIDILSHTRAWYKIERKKSYIKRTDLPQWYNAVNTLEPSNSLCNAKLVRDYLLFVLMTGVRRNEAASLKWTDVDLELKTFTLRDTKNSEQVTLPISDYLHEILTKRYDPSAEFVFPGKGKHGYIHNPTRQAERVAKLSEIPFSLHDLRRTFITIGESLDISHYTLKRLVNHKSIESQDVTAGYIIPNMERLRKATQQITDYILDVVNYDESVRIVSLEQAKMN